MAIAYGGTGQQLPFRYCFCRKSDFEKHLRLFSAMPCVARGGVLRTAVRSRSLDFMLAVTECSTAAIQYYRVVPTRQGQTANHHKTDIVPPLRRSASLIHVAMLAKRSASLNHASCCHACQADSA